MDKVEKVENILFEQLSLDKKLFLDPDSIDHEAAIKFAQEKCNFLNHTLDSFDSDFHLTILLPCQHLVTKKDFIEFKVVREQKLSLFVTNPQTKKSVNVDMETFFNLWIFLFVYRVIGHCEPILHVDVK
jgi:hypothetical protein